ncbi:hypothetical protein U27_00891 [Candidatus Vecturithrix granuli]|uniref:Uncharacterized protein n=1 Tax=Vecturithrix granuli TaxID=1499967 RepID=A0A081C8T8_VECG1|nr:hypothetical protein U27_00891 [Candidatus Vecturithrix granuli]
MKQIQHQAIIRMILWLFIWDILMCTRVYGQVSTYLLPLSGHVCQHGVHPQPDGGPFRCLSFVTMR